MKKIIIVFSLFFSSSIFAQEKILEFYNSSKDHESLIEGAIPIVNKENDEIAIIILDTRKAFGFLVGNKFKIKKQLSSGKRHRKYKYPLGGVFLPNDKYRIFISNKESDEFYMLNFSFKNGETTQTEIDLQLEEETFIQSITHKNNFYIMTVSNDSSILNIYSFDENGNYKKNEVNLSSQEIFNKKNQKTFLSKLLLDKRARYQIKINDIIPNSIRINTKESKFYAINNRLLLTLDHNLEKTQIITINLNNFESEFKNIEKPFKTLKSTKKKVNSFVYEDNIFTLGFTKEKFIFTIYNQKNDIQIKEYKIDINDSIYFKNTPFIRAISGEFISNKSKELKDTKMFLKKMGNSFDAGITVHKRNDIFQISLGGEEVLGVSGIGTLMGIHRTEPFSSYTNSILIYFDSLFDNDFNSVNGTIKPNAYDKIIAFKNESDYSAKGKIVFKYKGFYILGNHYYKSNKYILRKFND